MKKVLVNYADNNFKNQQLWNSRFAKFFGKVDEVIEYSPLDIDTKFKSKHDHILSQKKGGGYWLWKPYLIKKTLDLVEEGEYIIYLDSGSLLIRNVNHLISKLEESKQDVMVFSLPLTEYQWTKRDAFKLMECDIDEFVNSNQRLGGYIIIKKSKFSEDFINELLDYSCDDRIITDKDNELGFSNYSNFIAHRHDQSVLSLLSKKWDIKPFQDPSEYRDYVNINRKKEFTTIENEGIKINRTMVLSNRTHNPLVHLLKFLIKVGIKKMFPKYYMNNIY